MSKKFDYEAAVIGLELSHALALENAARKTPNTEAPQEAWTAFYKGGLALIKTVETPENIMDDFGILAHHDAGTNPKLAI